MVRRRRIGAKAIIGGVIVSFVGIMLRIFGPAPVAAVPIDPHRFADVIIGMGLCLLAGGMLASLIARN